METRSKRKKPGTIVLILALAVAAACGLWLVFARIDRFISESGLDLFRYVIDALFLFGAIVGAIFKTATKKPKDDHYTLPPR